MDPRKVIILGLIAAGLLVGYASLFTVLQTDYALKLRFGKAIRWDYDPGLQMKMPFIEKVRFFDRRLQTLDADPESFLTSEKKNLRVDSYVKWRITDVLKYFTTMGGSKQNARMRLGEIIADGLRSKFGKRTIQEVVSGDRTKIMESITEESDLKTRKYGIEIIDVRIKRIDLPKEVSDSVYSRMNTEREQEARKIRARGKAEAVRIRADADRKKIEIIAAADRDAEVTRGAGDGKAAETYAKAYNQDAEFYALYRSLNAYKKSFSNKSDVLVIDSDSDFFKYFRRSKEE
ncbi:MAG: protease modulator HflC [Gammaproteobacteria bacterium]|nr:protease modulator HflC [Gammaproteobacteria bacterium]